MLVIPVESIVDAEGTPMHFGGLKQWFGVVDTQGADVADAHPGASVVLDRFAYDLHLSDIGHTTDVHEGEAFHTAARTNGAVRVFVVDGVDPRRSTSADLEAAATAGRMIGGAVAAFTVDVLDS